jgi:hypothetical protein
MIIYILGEAHSGKSEAAKHIRRKYRTIEISLSDPMKRFLMELYGFTEEQLWGESSNRNGPDPRFPRLVGSFDEDTGKIECLSPREALQTLGEAMRGCFSDTWVRKLFETFKELERGATGYLPAIGLFGEHRPVAGMEPRPLGPFEDFLVPDVRYRNEHLALREAGALGFRLTSPSQGSGLTGNLSTHRSEVEQRTIPDSELHAVIVNDGTLEELYAKIDAFLEEHTTSS